MRRREHGVDGKRSKNKRRCNRKKRFYDELRIQTAKEEECNNPVSGEIRKRSNAGTRGASHKLYQNKKTQLPYKKNKAKNKG